MISILAILLGATYLWYYFSTDYQKLITEMARQKLFFIREQLFDAAMNNQIGFDDKAYGMTRKTLNGLINSCDDLHVITILLMVLTHRLLNRGFAEKINEYQQTLTDALNELPIESRNIIEGVRKDMHAAVLYKIMRSSILMWPVYLVFKMVFMLRHGVDDLLQVITDFFSKRDLLTVIDTHAKIYCKQP